MNKRDLEAGVYGVILPRHTPRYAPRFFVSLASASLRSSAFPPLAPRMGSSGIAVGDGNQAVKLPSPPLNMFAAAVVVRPPLPLRT